MKNTKIQVISLFSGAGGLDLGCKLNNIEIKIAIDNDNDSIETLKLIEPRYIQLIVLE